MFREGRKEEAGWILRKYEKTRLYQQKQVTVRAVFFYVNSYVGGNCLPQLQKLYQKQPENWILVLMLLEKDPKLQQDSRMAYKLLERQFRRGVRNRLLYQCAWELLKKDMALFTGLDAFALQTFAWASAHGFLTSETAMAAAQPGSRSEALVFSDGEAFKSLLSDGALQGDGRGGLRDLHPGT